MGANKRMDQILHILKTYQRTRSIKATVKATRCARNTIRSYLRLAAARDKDLNLVLALPAAELRLVFYPGTPAAQFDRRADFEQQFEHWVTELKRVGVTRHLLWQEYRERLPSGYGYTRWCNLLKELAAHRQLTLALEHEPGAELQFDYAGATVPWVDTATGEIMKAQVLLAVFPSASQPSTPSPSHCPVNGPRTLPAASSPPYPFLTASPVGSSRTISKPSSLSPIGTNQTSTRSVSSSPLITKSICWLPVRAIQKIKLPSKVVSEQSIPGFTLLCVIVNLPALPISTWPSPNSYAPTTSDLSKSGGAAG